MLDLIERAGHYTVFDGLSLLVLLVWAVFAFFVPATAAASLGRKCARFLATPALRFYRVLRKRSRFALYMTVFLISLIASVAVFIRVGEPVPAFHDEFSYLLAADTFAHGRLTNPTPAEFPSFETFHTLMQPTYMSRYHPAQGLTLALGQVATGFPIVGVWLMTAFACAAALWLLRSVLPGRWAFWGSVALALHPQITAWSTCYWGGGVALAGGALVLGGAARIAQTSLSPRRDGTLFGVGVGLLAMSRPFEGVVLICLTLLGLWWVLLSKRNSPNNAAAAERQRMRQGAGTALLPIGLTAAFLLTYNRAVTGSAWMLPYTLCLKTYDSYPPFRWWPALTMPTYHSPTLGIFYRHWAHKFDQAVSAPLGTFPHYAGLAWQAIFSLQWRGAFLGFLLFVGALAAIIGIKRLGFIFRGGLLIIAAFFAVLTGYFWILPHYAAPVVPAALALSLIGLRFLGTLRGRKMGRRTSTLLVSFVLPVLSLLTFAGYVMDQAVPGTAEFQSYDRYWNYARAAMQAKIASGGGKHLVFVEYRAPHVPDKEWVFNGADFADAPVLWAHSLGPEQNAAVQKAYPDRKAWFVVVSDATPPEAVPYAEGVGSTK